MFVQLRRVVYLLVLLQCCACVAYADSLHHSDNAYVTALKEKLTKDRDADADDELTKAVSALLLFEDKVSSFKSDSERFKAFVNKIEKVVAAKSTRNPPAPPRDNTELEMALTGYDTGSILLLKDTIETLKLAIAQCKRWYDILDKVIENIGKPSESDILESDGKPNSVTMPMTTYGEVYLLREKLSRATKGGLEYVKEAEGQEKVVEEKLKELQLTRQQHAESIKLRQSNKLTMMTLFNAHLERKEKVVRADRKENAREEKLKAREAAAKIRKEKPSGEGDPNTKETPAAQPPQAPVPPSQPSGGTSTPNDPTEATGGNTATVHGDPTTTEAIKKHSQNAAKAPVGSTAVLTVLALTVSTVIGVTVV